ncbi:MAG: hypothetical protein DCC49_06950 [Acidobacteria bacterium]|nr:MAG: hypothetical protein DCC49_06950 [Acidobacteriota bacterium]
MGGRAGSARSTTNGSSAAVRILCDRVHVFPFINRGPGRSHSSIPLGHETCARGKKVRYFRVTELITTLTEARDERSFLRIKNQLQRLDLLILDDLG